MKKHLGILAALLCLVGTQSASAARVENLGTGSAGGMTITVEGDLANFGGATKYSSVTTVGTDQTVTVAAVPPNTDFFFNFDGADLNALSIDTGTYQYAEIFYSLSGPWTAALADHALRLDTVTAGQVQNFVSFTNKGMIGNATGAQSFVIDLQNGTDLGTAAGNQYSGNLNFFRWDFFNNVAGGVSANTGNSLTLDKVVFGSALVAVPEPSSFALLGLGGLTMLRRRRK